MGVATGAAFKGADGYQMIAGGAAAIADELSGIGTITAVSVLGSPTGGTAGDVRKKRGVHLCQVGIDSEVIQVLYFMKGLANV